jgi:uncharacterized protein (DUF2147 family)
MVFIVCVIGSNKLMQAFTIKMRFFYSILLFFFIVAQSQAQTTKADDILGNWITPEKDLIVNCYKVHDKYFGKIVWYKHYGDALPHENYSVPQAQWINYVVMRNFVFVNNQWDEGEILEIKKGKKYDAFIKKNSANALVVTGYFMFKFLNEAQYFNRFDEAQLPK